MNKILCGIIFSFISMQSLAGPHYLTGNMSNIASNSGHLSIMLDTGVPDNCQGVPYNWMRIKKEDTPIVSMALAMWMAGKYKVTVYTKMEDGVCYIVSFDPVFNQ